MVSYINIAVDDDLAERARDVKDENDWSWSDFVERAAEELETDDG